MGLIGDLVYPDNPDLAREANADQQELEKIHSLHNQMVEIYRGLADDIRTFDSYLMALLVLQYHLVYTKEDLENLPDTNVPQITQSLADKIEQVGLDALAIKMGYNGVKAIYNRIANAYRESGSYRGNMDGGELSEEGAADLSEELVPEIDGIAAQSEFVSSGSVDLLTNTEMSTAELSSYATELGEAADSISTMSNSGELADASADLPELADGAEVGVEAAGEAAEGAEGAAEAAAEMGVEASAEAATAGAAALLGPAIIIVIVVAAIFELIEAGEEHAKLEKALKQLRKMIAQAEASLASLKKATKSLLISGKADIKAYDKMLAQLYKLEKNEKYNKSFASDGFQKFLDAVDGITVDNSGGLDGYKSAVEDNLTPATNYIRQQAISDSTMTEAISMMRDRVAAHGEGSIDADYLASVTAVLNISEAEAAGYNKFRKVLNDITSALAPYHEQVRAATSAGAKVPGKPANPQFGKMDPKFQPQPHQFQVPKVAGS